MTIRLRPGDPTRDAAAVAAVLNAVRTPPTTAEEVICSLGERPEGSISHLVIAEEWCGDSPTRQPEGAGEAFPVVGFAETHRFPNTAAGKFYADLAVLPASRRCGAGSALLAAVERFVREHGGNRIEGEVPEKDAPSLAFVEKHGYLRERRSFDSVLDLNGLDEAPLAGAVEAAEAKGIHFFTLADADGPETRQALYELYGRTMVDIPGYEAQSFMTYETWCRFLMEGEGARPDWVLIAAEGDRLVGVTQMIAVKEHVYTNHTLVDRAYRGRGIALALKLLTIRAAIRAGAPFMRTGNDSLNGPILAVNRRLGYRPLPGEYTVVRRLSADRG